MYGLIGTMALKSYAFSDLKSIFLTSFNSFITEIPYNVKTEGTVCNFCVVSFFECGTWFELKSLFPFGLMSL